MNKIIKLVCMAAIAIPLFATKSQAQNRIKVQSKSYDVLLRKMLNHSIPEISVDSLKRIEQKVTLLDAREIDEYNVSHLANASFVGYNNFKTDSLTDLPRNTPIVVYCSIGYRSGKIAEKLIGMGFTDVKNLYGGIFEWKNEGMKVYDMKGITENVHPYSNTWGIWLKKGNKAYQPR